jgi:LysM repeat protein
LSQAFKICPICDTPNPQNAAVCSNCGTALENVASVSSTQAKALRATEYESQFGENDLLEESLRPIARRYLTGCAAIVVLLLGAGLLVVFGPQFMDRLPPLPVGQRDFSLLTNTPRPTLNLATVTQGSPTLTPSPTAPPTATDTLTPTREPCSPQVQELEGLIAVVARCGHRDLFVLTEVIDLNELDNVNDIRPGQILIVPWPTETADPNATVEVIPTEDAVPEDPDNTDEAGSGETEETGINGASDINVEDTTQVSEFDFNLTVIADPASAPTATLPPGVGYYIVQPEDNAIIIADLFDTSMEVLSQLNPEITFSQCDFGQAFGGEGCSVPLGIGQVIRVPAPLPTETLTPTPSGSETATPTMTPTFNAPSSVSPSNRAFFRADQLVTLRWVATGMLDENQAYQVRLERTDDSQTFTETTQELFFRIPVAWQGMTADRYEYVWTVAVVDLDDPDEALYETEPLAFTWEGQGESQP